MPLMMRSMAKSTSAPSRKTLQSVTSISFESDIVDIGKRVKVSRLMKLYPQAGIKTCYAMLIASNGIFHDASSVLSTLFARVGTSTSPIDLTDDSPTKDPFAAARRSAKVNSIQARIDQKKAEFTAKAILGAAMPTKNIGNLFWKPKGGFKVFTQGHDLFRPEPDPRLVPSKICSGTTIDNYLPAFGYESDTDETLVLTTIASSRTYSKNCVEELRMEDYLCGRTKAPHLFSCFPKLPPEIRLMIWKAALSHPRVVELRFDADGYRFWSPAEVPALLWTSHEARTEASKFYSVVFGSPPFPPQTHFNYELDTLFLTAEGHRWDSAFEPDYEEVLDADITNEVTDNGESEKIRYLAVDIDLLKFIGDLFEDEIATYGLDMGQIPVLPAMPIISSFKNLEKLVIVDSQVNGPWKLLEECECDCECDCNRCLIEKCCRRRKCCFCYKVVDRKEANDRAVFDSYFSLPRKDIRDRTMRWLKKVRSYDEEFSIPKIDFMTKRPAD